MFIFFSSHSALLSFDTHGSFVPKWSVVKVKHISYHDDGINVSTLDAEPESKWKHLATNPHVDGHF